MKVFFHKIKDSIPSGVSVGYGTLQFCATQPIVIQPSETMKVPLNVIIKVEGNVVINVSTHKDMAGRVGELFPALTTIDSNSPEKPLELAVRNNGRNPIHLMAGQPVAVGHLYISEEPELEQFSVSVSSQEKPKSRPPKRNRDIKFEVK